MTTPKSDSENGRMQCKDCGCSHLPVVYTRHREGKVVRVRECRNCGRRVATREIAIGGELEAKPRQDA